MCATIGVRRNHSIIKPLFSSPFRTLCFLLCLLFSDLPFFSNATYIVYFSRVRPITKNRTKFFPVISTHVILKRYIISLTQPCNLSAVDITLDPPKDKRNVAISSDRRQVRYEHRLHQNKKASAVLGSLVITSGKHYWEVDVSEKQSWCMGVCGFKKDSDTSSDGRKQSHWVIGLQNHFVYYALGEFSSSDSFNVELILTVPPHRVGIFLDYDAHTVSFYNITNHGFLIYKFSSCSFSQKVYPYFCPMTCTGPMTLCSPSS